MHPETTKLTQKHALSNTDRKSTATTKPWFSRLLRYPARKRGGSILGRTHTRLLTYLLAPDPQGATKRDLLGVLRNYFVDNKKINKEHMVTMVTCKAATSLHQRPRYHDNDDNNSKNECRHTADDHQ